jgi:hypothetical protein
MRTPTQKLADILLGLPVENWIGERRAAGMSWRRISLELRDLTKGQMDVTAQTLITWADRSAA